MPVYSTALRYVTGSMATVGGGFLLTQSLAGDRHPEEPRSGVSKDEPRVRPSSFEARKSAHLRMTRASINSPAAPP